MHAMMATFSMLYILATYTRRPQHQYHGQIVPAFSTISCKFIWAGLGALPWFLATQVPPRSKVFLGCRGYLWWATGSLKLVGISAARNATDGNVDTSPDQEHTMLRYHCIADLSWHSCHDILKWWLLLLGPHWLTQAEQSCSDQGWGRASTHTTRRRCANLVPQGASHWHRPKRGMPWGLRMRQTQAIVNQ